MQIQELLSGKLNNKIFPFMWVHGESEAVYRDTIRAIDEANIKAFCVEARPHPEFCKEQWWTDMAIILDEAEKRGMKVWILDDKHFPTGYAAGAAETAPPELRRRSVLYREIAVNGPVSLDLKTAFVREKSTLQQMTDFSNDNQKAENIFDDDTFLAAAAVPLGVSFFGMNNRKPIPLDAYIRDGVLHWTPEEGAWKIALCWLSGNAGVHRNYINMTDPRSCRIQIDAVYETHYAHFKDKFGSVIAGFFSDEPELGNGAMFKMYNTLGTDQDLPWSLPIEQAMREKLGDDFSALLPLLWNNDCETALTAKVRYTYMDCVTRLVQKSFSEQIGDWCRAHGVEYIGHVIEDQNQHARTGTSLGHFFRGLRGQSMSGIDVIGGQIYPQGEDVRRKTIWGDPGDSEFFHYALAKLGSSLGELTPHMQDRTMIELFGAYGWSEGVQLEKYLADHCLVRGINHFVPHAFSCKAYPDPDCPPHFYAHGHDPLYRHFGRLMQYMNRVSSLLENGRTQAPAAILYHGEAEWCGDYMLMQKPARVLADRQIDFRFIPCDVFEEPDFYNTELSDTLRINGHTHNILFVPYAQFLPLTTLNCLAALAEHGCPVVFLDNLPDGAATGEPLPELGSARVLSIFLLILVGIQLVTMLGASLQFSRSTAITMVCMLVGISLMIFVANWVRKVLQKLHAKPWVNLLVTYGVIFALVSVMLAGIFAMVFRNNNSIFVDAPEYSTYESNDFTFRQYHDKLPLTVGDLVEDEYENWSTRLDRNSSFLLTHIEANQRPRVGDGDHPDLQYEVVIVKAPFLYDLCKQEYIDWLERDNDKLPEEYWDEYRSVDSTPWSASEVYQWYSSGEPYNQFLICWPDRIAEVDFDWDWVITDEIIATTTETLQNVT